MEDSCMKLYLSVDEYSKAKVLDMIGSIFDENHDYSLNQDYIEISVTKIGIQIDRIGKVYTAKDFLMLSTATG